MIRIVLRLWAMGIQAGVLICIILAVRFGLKKYPKIYSYSLWALAGIRLLCPLWIESPFSLLPDLSFAQYAETAVPQPDTPKTQPVQPSETGKPAGTARTSDTAQKTPQQDTSAPAKKMSLNQSGNSVSVQADKKGLYAQLMALLHGTGTELSASGILKLLAVLHLAVTMCFLAFYAVQYIWMKHKLAAAVREKDNIWLDGKIRSPFVMGLIAPKIYLPYSISDDRFFHDSTFIDNLNNNINNYDNHNTNTSCRGFSYDEKNWILEHERTHIRHHDPLIRVAGILCICLHWWNPLVWLAVSKMNEDMEMFCDETVLASAPAEKRKEYANVLLSYSIHQSGWQGGLAFGRSNTEKRIQNIMYKRKKNRLVPVLTGFLAAFCAAALLTVPETDAESHAKNRTASPAMSKALQENMPNGQTAETMQTDGQADVRADGQADVQADGQTDAKTSAFGYTEYNGYMDECMEWEGHTAFAGQDYDGDGQTDRVLRTWQKDSEYCHYRIEFGNQTVLDCDKDVYAHGTPLIKAADINGDGSNEIILLLQYEMSSDMRFFGDLAVFEKKDGSYVQAKLPFIESETGYSQQVPLHYRQKREQLITVSLDKTAGQTDAHEEIEINVPVSTMLWEDARYKELFTDPEDTDSSAVIWDVFLAEDGDHVKLACKLTLFDKWSDYGLILLLGYKNQQYVVEEVIPSSDTFSDSLPGTKATWELKDCRLCAKELKLADGSPVTLELWLEEGQYITGEDVLPAVGVYEENYQGKYVLITRDKNGDILDRHSLNGHPEDSAEFIFGSQTNFSGPFEIIEADYNKDNCPDFTIGAELSSSMNFFVLYTVTEDGKIKTLCSEAIPALEKASSIRLQQEGAGNSLVSYSFDNWLGKSQKQIYQWDGSKYHAVHET